MGFEVMEAGGKPIRIWLPEGHAIEDKARHQLARASRMPFVTDIACMPDVHASSRTT